MVLVPDFLSDLFTRAYFMGLSLQYMNKASDRTCPRLGDRIRAPSDKIRSVSFLSENWEFWHNIAQHESPDTLDYLEQYERTLSAYLNSRKIAFCSI